MRKGLDSHALRHWLVTTASHANNFGLGTMLVF